MASPENGGGGKEYSTLRGGSQFPRSEGAGRGRLRGRGGGRSMPGPLGDGGSDGCSRRRQGLRGLDPAALRALPRPADLRAVREGPRGAARLAPPRPGPRNRGGNG